MFMVFPGMLRPSTNKAICLKKDCMREEDALLSNRQIPGKMKAFSLLF